MKDIKDYLHLYTGCPMSTPYGECKFLYFKFHVDESQYNPVVVDRGDNYFAFKLDEVRLHLRPLSDMTEDEALECIKVFDEGITDDPQFKMLGKEENDWIYVEVNYEETECCWEPKPRWMNVELTRLLLSKGFDLFGLIEAGLAIDRTTLKQTA